MTKSITSDSTRKKLAWKLGELADALGLSKSLLIDQVRSGKLSARRLGKRRIVILDDDLRRWLRKAERVGMGGKK